MGVGGNQGIQAHPKPLGNKEHGIPGLHGVTALEARRTGGWNAAGGRWGYGTGNTEHITGEDNCWICDMRIGGNQGIEADPKPLGNKEHGIPRLHGVTALKSWWARGRDAAGLGRRRARNTEDIAGENDIWIGDMGISGNQGIQADPKPLGNEEHGVSGLHSISTLETWWARGGNAAGGRRRAGNTEDITGENHVRIGDMGVGGDQGIQAHPKPLGNEEHGIPGLHSISALETWWA